MAIRAARESAEPEEILFENTKVSLCLLLNRHAKSLRIFDFRAGADPTKRGYVLSIAQREQVERVYAVVERDEVGVWQRLGFQREGTIPGFFKRSDAYLLGTSVPPALEGGGAGAGGAGAGASSRSGEREAVSAATETLAEKTYQRARKLAKELGTPSARSVKLQVTTDAVVKKAVASAVKGNRALTRFDRFGRDVVRTDYHVTARGGWSVMASVERQPCFDNAFVELLTAPRTEREVALTHAALHVLCDRLHKEGTVACFATSPVDDEGLAAAWSGNGFRRTGTLPDHMLVGGRRVSAFLWTRKLSVPDDGDYE